MSQCGHCGNAHKIHTCPLCDLEVCENCSYLCDECNKFVCENCPTGCIHIKFCTYCNVEYCALNAGDDDYDSNKLCLPCKEKLNQYNDLVKDVDKLMKQVDSLKQENGQLKMELEYRPNGNGYLNTKKHFEKLKKNEYKSI